MSIAHRGELGTVSSQVEPKPVADAGVRAATPGDVLDAVGEARVSAIIVTWNRKEAVDHVLGALSRQLFPVERLDVVIVDNASTDGTLEHLAARWSPDAIVDNPTSKAHEPAFAPREAGESNANTGGFRSLTIVRNAANHGGCGGFNTGFAFVEQYLAMPAAARRPELAGKDRPAPEFIWLVDDDVDLPRDALMELVRCARSDENIGLVGSRTNDLNNRDETIETTIYFDTLRGRMGDHPDEANPKKPSHDLWQREVGGTKGRRFFTGARDVDVVSACSMLARWSAVQKVGFWDYRYFIYCDDADWCLRFAKAGYRVVCNLDAVVYHTPWHQKLTPARIYYAQRNVVWLLQKVAPPERLKRATAHWLASIMIDAFKSSLHRRLFHAEIIRKTAEDVMNARGGKLTDTGPAAEPVAEALDRAGALRASATVACMCCHPASVAWSEDVRARVHRYLSERGRLADFPRFTYMLRNDVHDSGSPALQGVSETPRRLLHGMSKYSRLRRQLPLIRRGPRAVVVFDQTNVIPLVRGSYNLHIDQKNAAVGQLERAGWSRWFGFVARWCRTGLRCAWYAARVKPYVSATRYG